MASTRTVRIGETAIGGTAPLALIAGPCQAEGEQHSVDIAGGWPRSVRARHRAGLQGELRQGEPDLALGPARSRARGGARLPRRSEARHRLPGADRCAPARAVRAGGRGGGCAADPGLPLPPDRSAAGRRRDGARGQCQEGAVPRPWDMDNVVAKLASTGNEAILPDRARHELRLQHAGDRHARPAADGRDRVSRGLRRDPFGAAAGRARRRLRRAARLRAGAGARGGGGGRRRASSSRRIPTPTARPRTGRT